MKEYISLIFKGAAMGAANVIPGVSGGTIALITGIFEKLIDSIKSFNLTAIKLFFSGKFKEFADYVNLWFVVSIFLGVGVSIFSLAKLLDYLFINYPVYIWSFFFGLILASVIFVAKTIGKWNIGVIISFIVGTACAVFISVLNPATENDSFFYIFVCGIVAACSMILPGLSGSFILILMGNYKLLMIDAVKDLVIVNLIPLIAGAGFGLIAFSHVLSWIFKKFKDQTIAVLSGFILGSLSILWPWKEELYVKDDAGEFIIKDGEKLIEGYTRYVPEFSTEVTIAIALMIVGFVSIWAIEKFAETKSE